MDNTVFAKESKVKDWATDPHLSREVKTFLKRLNTGGPGLETMSPEDARKVLEDAQTSVEVDYSGIEITEKNINTEGYAIKLYVVRPEGNTKTLPVFMFIHGGGWVLGDFPTHKRMVHDLVVLSGCASVFVEYTRTPDAKYPQAINEIFAATKWVAENDKELTVDGKNMALVGNSVGGNMTTVTCLKAKENNGPEIKLQIMMWPIVDSNFETRSYQEFGADRFLTTPLMKWMYDMYAPESQRKEIYNAPLNAP
jgi:acetyl esterase